MLNTCVRNPFIFGFVLLIFKKIIKIKSILIINNNGLCVKMKIVSDIMTSKVVSLNEKDNLHQGRMLLKQYGIRHLPIVSSLSGDFLGLLTQRDILNSAFNIVENYGFSKLKKREETILIEDVMTRDAMTIHSTAALKEAGKIFADKKCSCLPVVDDGKLAGILTSVDFVKLSLYLLD
jgi:CBS domain-containing membrane protein